MAIEWTTMLSVTIVLSAPERFIARFIFGHNKDWRTLKNVGERATQNWASLNWDFCPGLRNQPGVKSLQKAMGCN